MQARDSMLVTLAELHARGSVPTALLASLTGVATPEKDAKVSPISTSGSGGRSSSSASSSAS